MDSVEIKKVENSQVEISASIPASEYETYRKGALKALGESMHIDGFRKGNIPENVIEQKAGEVAILHEMASRAIADFYPKIIEEKKIEAIGRPEVTITKMAKGNPLEFKATTAVVPGVILPDYKALAGGVLQGEEVIVTDDEVEKVILEIRTNWAHQMERVKDTGTPTSTEEKPKEPALPELNDEFIKQLGEFKTVSEFKEKLKENIKEEKKTKEHEKRRGAIIEALLKETSIAVPDILVEGELSRMMAQFKDNVAMMGQKPEEYFKQIKKTEDEVRAGWRADAEKRAKTQLVLHKIAETENLVVPEEELKKQIDEVIAKYPEVKEAQARGYVENILLNEKTFEFLESQK